jgi:hypothetical protein
MTVYLASDIPLKIIEWDQADPRFNVTELHDEEKGVKRHFSKSYVYSIGAHTCCGCGFSEYYGDKNDAVQDSVTRFIRYIKDAIGKGSMELFICWEGDINIDPVNKLSLKPNDLIYSEKWHKELTYVYISENVAS